MLSRNIQYVWKLGEYKLYTGDGAIAFVGGSPVKLKQSSTTGIGDLSAAPPVDAVGSLDVEVTGADVLDTYIGVAYHSNKVCEYVGKVTVVKAPAIIEIYKGISTYKEFQKAEEFYPFGFTENDAVAPFDTNDTYEAGDYLKPATVEVNGVTYAIWDKVDTSGLADGTYVYPAMVIGVIGSGANMILRVELGTFIYYKSSS